eukprot:SAG11_NODE_510_length_8851_cov_25.360718_3_plen_188_part_00
MRSGRHHGAGNRTHSESTLLNSRCAGCGFKNGSTKINTKTQPARQPHKEREGERSGAHTCAVCVAAPCKILIVVKMAKRQKTKQTAIGEQQQQAASSKQQASFFKQQTPASKLNSKHQTANSKQQTKKGKQTKPRKRWTAANAQGDVQTRLPGIYQGNAQVACMGAQNVQALARTHLMPRRGDQRSC